MNSLHVMDIYTLYFILMTATACVGLCRACTVNDIDNKSVCFVSISIFIEYTITIYKKYRVKFKTKT